MVDGNQTLSEIADGPLLAIRDSAYPPTREEIAAAQDYRRVVIQGQRVCSPTGLEIILGAVPEVENTIGLVFNTVSAQEQTIKRLDDQLTAVKRSVKNLDAEIVLRRSQILLLQKFTWKQRLAFLFRGEKYSKLPSLEK